MDPIIEGAANGRRLLRHRNSQTSDANDYHASEEKRHTEIWIILTFDKDLCVSFGGGLLCLQLFQLLRILVLDRISDRALLEAKMGHTMSDGFRTIRHALLMSPAAPVFLCPSSEDAWMTSLRCRTWYF